MRCGKSFTPEFFVSNSLKIVKKKKTKKEEETFESPLMIPYFYVGQNKCISVEDTLSIHYYILSHLTQKVSPSHQTDVVMLR